MCRVFLVLFLWMGMAGVFLPTPALANREPDHRTLPYLDKRFEQRGRAALPPAAHQPKVHPLQGKVPGLSMDSHPLFKRAKHVHSRHGFLTGPGGQGGAVNPNTLQTIPAGERHRVIKAFLQDNKDVFGFGREGVDHARMVREYVTPHNGARTVVWQQQHQGVDIYQGVLVGHVTRAGELASLTSEFVADPDQAAGRGKVRPDPLVGVLEAILVASRAVEEPSVKRADILPVDPQPVGRELRQAFKTDLLPGNIQTRLVWLPWSDNLMKLCWEIELVRRQGGELYRVVVDASNGEILIRVCRTMYLTEASYRVFTSDSPSPFSPGHADPSTNQPPLVERDLVVLSALSTNASPTGWIHDGENETRGNNVEAHLDRNADNLPDLPRPQGSPFRVFDFPMDLTQDPGSHGQASAVQLFYWCNWMHDQLYEMGFTEAAGNFQKDNFGRGGLGNDPVIADAQDGSGFNNANYTPSQDGFSPRIQMFLFNGPEPDRDGTLDADIVLHEYTHGLTDRLVGGGAGLFALQSTGMGEGWSDFYALAFLSEAADDPHGNYTEGGYATWRFDGLRENYYYGIRRYPYTTDMSRNPLTFKDIDPSQISEYPQVPRSPIHPFNPDKANRVHRMGEVWCVTLWEARANLIDRYGFETGNPLILQLVTDGLKLAPANPTFLQARDAIILADRIYTGGQNQFELWSAFAKRGMGVSASGASSQTTDGIQEAFDLPDLLSVQPLTVQRFTGAEGGVLVPDCHTWTLSNPGEEAIDFSLSHTRDWLDLDRVSGVIPPAGEITITACLNSRALALSAGVHLDVLSISNLNTGAVLGRTVEVRAFRPALMPFVENFESGSLSSYWLSEGQGFPRTKVSTNDQPYEGNFHLTMDTSRDNFESRNELTLGLDLEGYTNVVLSFQARSFRDDPDPIPSSPFMGGADFDGVAVSDDGVSWYVVYDFQQVGIGDTEVVIPLDDMVRREGLVFDDAFRIRFNQYDNNVIPLDGIALDNIRVTGVAARRFQVQLPSLVVEGSGTLPGAGVVTLPVPASEAVEVELISGNPDRLLAPATVTIPAGAQSMEFDLVVLDNDFLEGKSQVELRVSAPGYIADGSSLTIADDESTQIILSVPSAGREGQGLLEEEGRLFVDRAPDADMVIRLASSDLTEIFLPATVTLPAGETSLQFDVGIVDDREIDGTQTVLVDAFGDNFIGDSDVIMVSDNESRGIFLSGPSLLLEGSMLLINRGTLALGGVLTTNLVVSLTSSDPARIMVPETLEIPAGELFVSFDIEVLEDTASTGSSLVFLNGQAEGFSSGGLAIRILDQDIPPSVYGPTPPHGATNQPVDLSLQWRYGFEELVVNGGFERGNLSGWAMIPGFSGSFVINDGTVDPQGPGEPSQPFAGSYDALALQLGPGTQLLYQDVSLPQFVGRLELSWVDRVRNHGPAYSSNHQFRVEIRNTANTFLGMAFATAEGHPLLNDWVERRFDLTPWRGQRVRLAFEEEDENGFLNVQLDQVRILIDDEQSTISEVYFGTEPILGAAQFQGLTEDLSWALPTLDLNTFYYWQVVGRRGVVRMPGPVWRFRTRAVGGLDHFLWEPVAGHPLVSEAFPVMLTARDDLGQVVSNFFGNVTLSASRSARSDPVQILTFTGYANTVAKYRPTLGAIATHFTNFVETSTTVAEPTVLQSQLSDKDVFLIMEQQFAPSGQMEQLGNSWGKLLEQFAMNGGVVIVCSYFKDEHRILTQSGLLKLSKLDRAQSTEVVGIVPGPLTEGIDSPFTAIHTARYTALEVGEAVLLDASTNMIVVNRRIGDGLVALIGTDYLTNRTSLDRLLANAVQFKQQGTRLPVPVTPAQSQYFANGSWTGNVAVHETGKDMILEADHQGLARGLSPPFTVTALQDLSLEVTDSPDPLLMGELLTYRITLSNSGPEAVPSVSLTNVLAEEVLLQSILVSQGICSETNGLVYCQLGEILPGQEIELTLMVEPQRSVLLTNLVSVTGAVDEAYLLNNQVTTVSRVNPPGLLASNATVTEGNGSPVMATIELNLFPPSPALVSCDYTTTNNTALPGQDYENQTGTVFFLPGETNQTISIPILADQLNEGFENFFINFYNPVEVLLINNQILVGIHDDDPEPVLSVNDVVLTEGDDETTTNAVFRFELSRPSGRSVEVRYVAEGESATVNKDFAATSGTLVFSPGSTNFTLLVQVNGDDSPETNEVFLVRLSPAVGVVLPDEPARALIIDDDEERLSHFVWGEIAPQQFLNKAFPVTLRAEDTQNNLVTGFSGQVVLSGLVDPQEIEPGVSAGLWDYPMGASFHDQRLQSLYLADELGGPSRITALSLRVGVLPGQRLNNWTIRLKHTLLSQYQSAVWETNGWQVVYRQNEILAENGWVTFPFVEPFLYNGQDHLMVDFSFDNTSFSSDGLSYYMSTETPRSLHQRSDSGFGDPTLWSGGKVPPPDLSERVPLVRFSTEGPVAISPSVVSNFVGGIWTGEVISLETARSMQLRGRVEEGAEGLSQSFQVDAIDDLGLAISFAPDPVTIDGLVTFTFQVTNTGPSISTGVILSNQMPSSLVFQEVESSHGTCAVVDGVLRCDLGAIVAESQAIVQLTALSSSTGLITNQAEVVRLEPEAFLVNNRAVTIARAQPPGISMGDVIVAEGDEGISQAVFSLTLSNPTELTVSLHYATEGASATNLNDFVQTEGVLIFEPGQTNQQIVVDVVGDRRNEIDETFYLVLSQPDNVVFNQDRAAATIIDEDPFPEISVFDLSLTEMDDGVQSAIFHMTLSEASGKLIRVQYATRNGTATVGQDYASRSGMVFFPPGLTEWIIYVPVYGDEDTEPDENFFLTLTNAVNAGLGQAEAEAIILTDDGLPGVLDHFEWGLVEPIQFVGQSFNATLTAKDFFNQTVTNYLGFAQLKGRTGHPDLTTVSGDEMVRSPLGSGYHDQRSQMIYLSEEIGNATEMLGLSLEVLLPPEQTLNRFTIRLKHVSQNRFFSPAWDNEGWTTVVQTNLSQVSSGSLTVYFDEPFSYNGSSHLMIDVSFNNSFFTLDGVVKGASESGLMVQSAQSDSEFGDPLNWTGANSPRPVLSRDRPTLTFLLGVDVPLVPGFVAEFSQGKWSGEMLVNQSADALIMVADDGLEHLGVSGAFQVVPSGDVDSDEDGMDDAWEWRFFGSLDAANGAPSLDPDGDGVSNLEESKAATDPLDASSLFILTHISVQDDQVLLRFNSVDGHRYRVERSSFPEQTEWTTVTDEIEGDGTEIEVVDSVSVDEASQFYRVLLLD